ncbi:YunG family protein [Streptomyces decoyicus]
MTPWSLLDLDKALRASWAADTCSPDNQVDWQPSNPAWGHRDITALIVNDISGGDLVVGEMHLAGVQHGFHWWNRLTRRSTWDPAEVGEYLAVAVGRLARGARRLDEPSGSGTPAFRPPLIEHRSPLRKGPCITHLQRTAQRRAAQPDRKTCVRNPGGVVEPTTPPGPPWRRHVDDKRTTHRRGPARADGSQGDHLGCGARAIRRTAAQ